MKRPNFLYLTAGIAVAIVISAVYFLNSSNPQSPLASSPASAKASSQNSASASPQSSVASTKSDTTNAAHPEDRTSQVEKVNPENYRGGPKQPWEKEIIGVVSRLDLPDAAKVKELLSKIPRLPPDGKVLAMEHAAKLIPDEEYVGLRPTLFGLVTTPELRETVLLDALTRGEEVRMPTLVEMLRQPPNPGQAEVREILVAYLDQDYGTDFKQWDAAVSKFLVENPDL